MMIKKKKISQFNRFFQRGKEGIKIEKATKKAKSND